MSNAGRGVWIGLWIGLWGCTATPEVPAAPVAPSVAAPWSVRSDEASLSLLEGSRVELRWAGHAIALGVDGAVHGERAHLEIARAGALERIALRDGALHQTFHFEGPLTEARTFRVPLHGVSFLRDDAAGLHFATRDGALVRYSHARLVDADGRHVPVPARWAGDVIELRVPARPELRAPIVLDPTLGPERGLDTPIAVVGRSNEELALTTSGSGYHVLFGLDGLRHAALAGDLSGGPQVGTPLSRFYERPVLARAGDVLLFAWVNDDPGEPALFFQRFAADGTAIDAAPVVIDYDGGSGSRLRPAIATDGTSFLVTYTSGIEIYARRVSARGPLPGPAALLIDDRDCVDSAVAHVSGRYVVAASCDDDADGDTEVVGVVVDAAGVDGAPVVIAGEGEMARHPRLVRSGAGLVLAWHTMAVRGGGYQLDGILARRLDDDGALGLGPVRSIATTPAFTRDEALALSDDGVTTAIAWSDRASSTVPSEVWVSRLSAAGALLDAAPRRAGEGSLPAAAPGSGEHLLAWRNSASTIGSPQGRRVRDDGTFVDATPVPLAARANGQSYPTVAAGGGIYLAVFQDTREPIGLYAVRIDPELGVLDDPALHLTTGLSSFVDAHVTFVGDAFQVLYAADPGSGTGFDVFGTRVGLDGSVDPPRGWHTAPGGQVSITASHVDEGVLVAWLDASAGGAEAWGRMFDTDGAPSGAAFAISGDTRTNGVWSTAGHGVHVVYWRLQLSPFATDSNRAARFSSAGVRLDPTALVLPGHRAPRPVVISGTSRFVAFGSSRMETRAATIDPVTGAVSPFRTLASSVADDAAWYGAIATEGVLWGVRAANEGADLVPADEDATSPPGHATTPVTIGPYTSEPEVAHDATSWAVVYQRETPAAPYANDRVYFRLSTTELLPDGAACSADASCASGFCTDGVCCDARCDGGTSDCQACSVAAGAAVNGVCGLRASGATCRSAAGACDVAEVCDGSVGACPSDALAVDGSACADALTCDGIETCAAGACVEGAALDCDDGDPCTIDGCGEPDGCTHARDPACDDGGVPELDAGTDAGTDAGPPDAGPPDAGPPDAGAPDAGPPDAGRPDAGPPGVDGGPPVAASAGCGCRATRRDLDARWLAIVLGAALLRRRR